MEVKIHLSRTYKNKKTCVVLEQIQEVLKFVRFTGISANLSTLTESKFLHRVNIALGFTENDLPVQSGDM